MSDEDRAAKIHKLRVPHPTTCEGLLRDALDFLKANPADAAWVVTLSSEDGRVEVGWMGSELELLGMLDVAKERILERHRSDD